MTTASSKLHRKHEQWCQLKRQNSTHSTHTKTHTLGNRDTHNGAMDFRCKHTQTWCTVHMQAHTHTQTQTHAHTHTHTHSLIRERIATASSLAQIMRGRRLCVCVCMYACVCVCVCVCV